jgi:acetolactate synthase I/II/III large subunit
LGTVEPVAFFAYPDMPSSLTPTGASVVTLASQNEDIIAAVEQLANALAAPAVIGPAQPAPVSPLTNGPLTTASAAASLASRLPSGSIICDDAITAGPDLYAATRNAAEHRWLCQTGGAIGAALPMAIGAAIAEPSAKVFALSGDGSAMYTLQALWTMAREKLPIVSIIFSNRSYRILNIEMARTGAGEPGPAAASMLSLDNPPLDWVSIARGHGVEAFACDTAKGFDEALQYAIAVEMPVLIEAVTT